MMKSSEKFALWIMTLAVFIPLAVFVTPFLTGSINDSYSALSYGIILRVWLLPVAAIGYLAASLFLVVNTKGDRVWTGFFIIGLLIVGTTLLIKTRP